MSKLIQHLKKIADECLLKPEDTLEITIRKVLMRKYAMECITKEMCKDIENFVLDVFGIKAVCNDGVCRRV